MNKLIRELKLTVHQTQIQRRTQMMIPNFYTIRLLSNLYFPLVLTQTDSRRNVDMYFYLVFSFQSLPNQETWIYIFTSFWWGFGRRWGGSGGGRWRWWWAVVDMPVWEVEVMG